MLATIVNHVQVAAKAYVAVATPIIAGAVTQLVAELDTAISLLVTAVVTSVIVWLTPNKPA
jgi:hypothetical protein